MKVFSTPFIYVQWSSNVRKPVPVILVWEFNSWFRNLRDWSIITGRRGGGGGGLQNGKNRVKLFCALPFKGGGNFLRPTFSMAKTSCYRIKTTPKLVVPSLSTGKTFCAPPFSYGLNFTCPGSPPYLPFCSPPTRN